MEDEIKTPEGVPDLTKSEVDKAKHDGAVDYIKEGVAGAMATDTGTAGDAAATAEAQAKLMPADLNTTFIAPLLNLGVEAFEDRISEKPETDPVLDENVVKGLLALERNGQNRTPYVQALCKRLKVKSPLEVYHGGPGFTNDVTAVTAL